MKIDVDPDELYKFLKKDSHHTMLLEFRDVATATVKDPDSCNYTRNLPGEVDRDGMLCVSVNPRYLKDIARFSNEKLSIKITGDVFTVNDKGEVNYNNRMFVETEDGSLFVVMLINENSKWEQFDTPVKSQPETLHPVMVERETEVQLESTQVETVGCEVQTSSNQTEPVQTNELEPTESITVPDVLVEPNDKTSCRVHPQSCYLSHSRRVPDFSNTTHAIGCNGKARTLQGKFQEHQIDGHSPGDSIPQRTRAVPLVGSGFV